MKNRCPGKMSAVEFLQKWFTMHTMTCIARKNDKQWLAALDNPMQKLEVHLSCPCMTGDDATEMSSVWGCSEQMCVGSNGLQKCAGSDVA